MFPYIALNLSITHFELDLYLGHSDFLRLPIFFLLSHFFLLLYTWVINLHPLHMSLNL
jgi:hypothetical protein